MSGSSGQQRPENTVAFPVSSVNERQKMEAFKKCQAEMALLEKRLTESTSRWKTFLASQASYQSLLSCDGKPLPAPVMTPEKRRKMQMYRKQAYIVEVRIKSRSREREFFDKIQGALDEVRDIRFDNSHSCSLKAADYPCARIQEGRHQHISAVEAKIPKEVLVFKSKKAKSTTDLSKVGHIGENKPSKEKPPCKVAKVKGRRRYNSEGKSDSDSQKAVQTTPCKSSGTPSHSAKRSHSSSNLLTIPFEQYQQEVEDRELGLSRPRQRYREEKARANATRTPSPQPTHNLPVSQANRPVSTPPVVSTVGYAIPIKSTVNQDTPAQKIYSPSKGSFDNVATHTVSCKALKCLLDTLDPCHDQPTHQWLTARVSDQVRNAQEDISLDDWFQNAPDSVKQKLASLLPKVPVDSHQQTDDRKVVNNKTVDVHISAVHTCNSSDDTLRSTSPLPDEDGSGISTSFAADYVPEINTEDDQPMIVIDKSPNSSQKMSLSLVKTDSFTGQEVCSNSIDTVIEVDISSRRDVPVVPPLQLSPQEPPTSNSVVGDSMRRHLPETPAEGRKRTLSMQSYTVEEPSEALLNFTLQSENENTTPQNKPATKNSKSKPQKASAKKTPVNSLKANDAGNVSFTGYDRYGSDKSVCKMFKSRIPTPKTNSTLLSKCQMDTPSPALAENAEKDNKLTNQQRHRHRPSSTPINAGRHMHLLKLLKNAEMPARALTPTPPSRVLTPTPPSNRPKSEMGMRWNRSRTHSKNKETRTVVAEVTKHEVRDGKSVVRSESCHLAVAQETSDSSKKTTKKVQRSVSYGQATLVEMQSDSPIKITESPLKDYDGRDDKLVRARKQLALLKSKFTTKAQAMKLERFNILQSATIIDKAPPTIASGSTEGINFPSITVQPPTPVKESPPVLHIDDGKENINQVEENKKTESNRSFLDREETPINTAYSASNSVEAAMDFGSLGNILSVSHKTNRLSSGDSTRGYEQRLAEDKLLAVRLPDTSRLHAVIKGHLCRKLFKCSKVKSIIKTIQDCRNLLPSITSVNNNSALYDINFQQRLKLQMDAARIDLHEIFFSLPSYQRILLIKQSEMVLARHRLRQKKANKLDQSSKLETSGDIASQGRRKRNKAADSTNNIMVRPRIHTAHNTVSTLRNYNRHNDVLKPVAV